MGIKIYGPVIPANQITTQVAHLPFANMFDDNEEPLATGTLPAPPTYDTGVTGAFGCDTQTNDGTVTDVFWTIWRLPSGYNRASDLTVMIDGLQILGGDAVNVARTIDCEVFLYDSTNGDYSNSDISATSVITITTSYATHSFTITGTTLDPGVSILIRFTSVTQITSAGGAGTGQNRFNNAQVQYAGQF